MNISNHPLAEKYQDLSVREKALLLGSAVVVLYLIFDLLFFTPMNEEQDRLVKEKDQLFEEKTTLSGQLAQVAAAINTDPDKDLKLQLQSLIRQRERLDSELQSMSSGLIAADKLPSLLQDVLVNLTDLEFIELETQPIEQLMLNIDPGEDLVTDESGEESDEEGGLLVEDELPSQVEVDGLYKHAVSISIKGNYESVLIYLQSLENMEWKFFWDEIVYEVETYPNAHIKLSVYTLSTDIGVLGGES